MVEKVRNKYGYRWELYKRKYNYWVELGKPHGQEFYFLRLNDKKLGAIALNEEELKKVYKSLKEVLKKEGIIKWWE